MAKKRRSRIPSGPLERLGRIGWMAGELAVGGLVEKSRRLAGVGDAGSGSSLLTAANAQRLARRLSTLRGAAMKLGQLLSLEGEDLLSSDVARALSILRSDADAMPDAQVGQVLARELGRDWPERFRSFDFDPIASASIGQVHACVAADGRELAVKVQYPGVARSIESDVDNLATALRLSRLLPADLDIGGLLEEAKRQLRDEADYRSEAARLRRYAACVEDDPDVLVPRVHGDLSSRHVLAMDRLRGLPLEELRGAEYPEAERDRVGTLLYRLLFDELFAFRFVQSDPNFANYMWLPDQRRVGLLDFGAAREVSRELSGLYLRLFRAALSGERGALRRVAREIGFFSGDEPLAQIRGVVELLEAGCEPFRHAGAYDFASSDLPPRLRERGMRLAFSEGFRRPPPPETIFLHRKLGGIFLLCARLRARVDVRTLLEPHLGSPAYASDAAAERAYASRLAERSLA